jgi:hypothetical protein
MKLGILAGLIAGLCCVAGAQAREPQGGLVVSTVDSVYVREHAGLFIEARLVSRARRGELWALVRYPADGDARGASELTRIPPDLDLRVGDLVEVHLGESKATLTSGPMPAAARVVRVLHADTRLAGQLPAVGAAIANSR